MFHNLFCVQVVILISTLNKGAICRTTISRCLYNFLLMPILIVLFYAHIHAHTRVYNFKLNLI